MSEPTIESLLYRVQNLEKQNRRIKRLGYLIVGGISVALVMGQSQCNRNRIGLNQPPNVLETQKLIIRDFTGKPHVELTAQGLTFTDDDGQILVSLQGFRSPSAPVPTEVVGLSLFGLNGSIQLSAGSINLKKDGPKPFVAVSDDEDNAQSFVSPADINLWYAKKPRAYLTAGKDGTSISFYDPVGLPRVELGIDTHGGNLNLADKNHKTRVVIGSTALVNQHTGATTITPEEALTLFDKNGKVSWQTPR
jgi:hypothetical protein